MEAFIFALISGLLTGAIYTLSAIGLSMVAGLMRIVQFAHGEFYVLGAYLSAIYSVQFGFLGAALAVFSVFVLGWLIEKIFIRSYFQQPSRTMMMTFLLSMVLQNGLLFVFGPYPRKPPIWIDGSTELVYGIMFGNQRLLSGLIAAVIFLIFYIWIKTSKLGLVIRATAQDPIVAQSLGANPVHVRTFAFALSAALAALSGVILSPSFAVVPDSGSSITLASIVIMVMGGMGSVRGCLLGGMVLALSESFGATYISTAYTPLFGFVILISVILWMPKGIYGNRI
jgi:branched-chain amino acid transport system permease protein